MKRLVWLLVLPLVWFPLIALALLLFPALPWYAWAFGVVVVVAFRRRRGAAVAVERVEGVAGSPTITRLGF